MSGSPLGADQFPMQVLNLIAVLTLILVVVLLGAIAAYLLPHARIWGEKFAIWRRDNRQFREELRRREIGRLYRAPAPRQPMVTDPAEAWRFGLARDLRPKRPLICVCCGFSAQTITDAAIHRCAPTEDTQ